MKNKSSVVLLGLALCLLVLGAAQGQAQSATRGSGSTQYPAHPTGPNKVPELGKGEDETLAVLLHNICDNLIKSIKREPAPIPMKQGPAPLESNKNCTGRASECGALNPSKPSSSGPQIEYSEAECKAMFLESLKAAQLLDKEREERMKKALRKKDPNNPLLQ